MRKINGIVYNNVMPCQYPDLNDQEIADVSYVYSQQFWKQSISGKSTEVKLASNN